MAHATLGRSTETKKITTRKTLIRKESIMSIKSEPIMARYFGGHQYIVTETTVNDNPIMVNVERGGRDVQVSTRRVGDSMSIHMIDADGDSTHLMIPREVFIRWAESAIKAGGQP